MSGQQPTGISQALFSSLFSIPPEILFSNRPTINLQGATGAPGSLGPTITGISQNPIHPTINRNLNINSSSRARLNLPNTQPLPSSSSSNNRDLLVPEDQNKNIISNERYKDLESIKDKGLECPICLSVINGTVAVTTCIHKFCSSCLYQHCMSSANTSCPLCRSELNPENIVISDDLSLYLDNCIVVCKNLECTVEVERKNYDQHNSTCPYNKKQCNDCKSLIYERNMEKHKEECDYRSIKCNLCRAIVPIRKQEEHRNTSCPFNVAKCKNEKCNFTTQRHRMHKHTHECIYREISCVNGCSATIEFRDVSLHNETCPRRKILCIECTATILCSNAEIHYLSCPKRIRECEYCNENVINSNIHHHYRSCSKKLIPCPNECGESIERRYLLNHNNVCQNRSNKCVECKQHYILSHQDSHDRSCPNKRVNCHDCNESIMRKDLSEHSSSCQYKSLLCKYHYASCIGKFLRVNEQDHYEQYKDHHLQLLEEYININVLKKKDESDNDEEDEEEDILGRDKPISNQHGPKCRSGCKHNFSRFDVANESSEDDDID